MEYFATEIMRKLLILSSFREGWCQSKPTIALPVSFPHELRHCLVGSAQHRFLREKHNADVARARLLAEAGTVHDQHVLLLEQVGDEGKILFGDLQSGMRIESALRRDQLHPRRALGPLDRNLGAAPQFFADFDEMVLRAFQRRADGVLKRMRG